MDTDNEVQPVPPADPPPSDPPPPSDQTADPSDGAPVTPLPKSRTERAGTLVAWCVPALLLAAVVIALVPVRNGRVQDCGAPIAFVAQGRTEAQLPDVDRAGQKDTPPKNFTEAEYRDAAEHSCRERVAPRMVWAGALTLAALVLGLGALVATVVGRYWFT
jgi:hypothetical protein